MRDQRDPGRLYVAPVQRWRIRYAKRGRMRFASHRDFQRALERALRRAAVPMAYSAGFRPHPKISYANAVPTGAASEAEYLEIGVASEISRDVLAVELDRALPDGFDIVDAVIAGPGDLVAQLSASVWMIELPELEASSIQVPVADLLASEQILIERVTKSGRKELDARAAISGMRIRGNQQSDAPCAIIDLVLTHATPSVRPQDVLAALWRVGNIAPPKPPRVTRLAQGLLAAGAWDVSDPLAPDRAGSKHAKP